MDPSIISGLTGMGAAGAVILAMFYYLQHEAKRDRLRGEEEQRVIDRIDKIVDRHLASEEANRQQVRDFAEQNRVLFDRVIGICSDMSVAVKDLSSNTRANEKAIRDLRQEFRSISGPQSQPHKALGHEDPRPFPHG